MIRVYQLAKKLNLSSKELLMFSLKLGMKTKSNLSGLSSEEVKKIEKLVLSKRTSIEKKEAFPPRAPVVTFLGHVDHGKTSLLDAVRETVIAKKEIGGITQRIGASEIEFHNKRIVFIDTPGHEAFTAMRAHGARVTDIAVLVIAADDGVMPQTIEAINHARAAKVPIIVAINKIDKSESNPQRVKKQLTKYDLIPEEWGGETICVEVSALSKKGLDNLLDMILLEAEMLELTSDPNGKLEAIVIEGELDRKKGPSSTLLIKKGTLHIGDVLVGGHIYGKVRALINWKNERLDKADSSTAVKVLGLSDVGKPGDIFKKVRNEKEARQLAEGAKEKERKKSLRKRSIVDLETFYKQEEEKEKVLNLILKADTQGTLRAISDSLKNLESEDVKIVILHEGVGEVKKADILLASTSKGIIIGFNVEITPENLALAKEERVEIRNYQIIYEIMDDIKKLLYGLLQPKYKEVIIGKIEVRDIFNISKVGVVAGSYVTEGKVFRGSKVKILRENETIGQGVIGSLKRFTQDVNEVRAGLECGINIEGFNGMKKGDLIEAYELKKIN